MSSLRLPSLFGRRLNTLPANTQVVERRPLLVKSLAVLTAACLQAAFLSYAAGAVAIQDVTVIDIATGTARPHITLIIDGERIRTMGPAASTTIAKGIATVDGKGKFLIPGLWDTHVHLWYPENQLPVYVAFGVTGVQDMGSDFKRTSAWRAQIVAGKAVGPHIITCGPPVVEKSTGDEKLPGLIARTPEEARKAFDELWNMNVDFMKVLSGLSKDAYLALAEQSRHWRLPLRGHVPRSLTAMEAVEARQNSLEHFFGVQGVLLGEGGDLDEKKTLEFFEKSAAVGTRHSPTLLLWRRMGHLDDAALKNDERLKYVPESIRKTWPDPAEDTKKWTDATRAQWKAQVDRIYRITALAKRTKVELLAGTDTGDPYTIPGASLHDELEQLVRAGLTAREALEAATITPARMLGWDEAMGTIEKGKVADLVLLEANPIDDIRNTRRISAVFSRGKHLSRKDLDGILASAADVAEKPTTQRGK